MSITAAMVKDLREKTAAGMMDCKKALTECDGDMEKAVDWLRQKGLSKAAQKAGRFDDEIVPELTFDRPYLLAMANAGLRRGRDGKAHGTNGSQFFITTVPTPWLDGHHTIFGEVADDDSKKVVDKLEALDTDPMDRPLEPAVILSVDVAE